MLDEHRKLIRFDSNQRFQYFICYLDGITGIYL